MAGLVELVDGAPEGVAVLSPDGRVVAHVNAAGQRILGLTNGSTGHLPAESSPFAGMTGDTSATGTVVLDGREVEYVRTSIRTGQGQVEVLRFRDVTDVRLQERRLKTFSRTSASVAFAESLTTGLDRLAADVQAVSDMHSCTFLLMDEDGALRQSGSSGIYASAPDYGSRLAACRELGAPLLSQVAFDTGQPQVVTDWRQRTLADHRFSPLHDLSRTATWETIAVVPLIVRGRTVGVFNGFYERGHEPSTADISFLCAIADQAAVAVDNAQMLRELERKAADDERHRLARNLHDSISQALFSMTLQTRAIELLAGQDPLPLASIAAGLGELRELTQGALAEMRALIFQLRPEALHEEGLVSAIRRQGDAIQARERLAVSVHAPKEALALTSDAETELFRFVVEAMTNVVKHADATTLDVFLQPDNTNATWLAVCVRDNGRGFNTDRTFPGHLGLVSMSERVAGLGGVLHLDSAPGGPTAVRAIVPVLRGPSTSALETIHP